MSETVKIILGSIVGSFFLGLFTFLGIFVKERNKTKRQKFKLKHQTFIVEMSAEEENKFSDLLKEENDI
ncbi:hypothetical protein C6B38_02005 [Spiroplasma sp. ChiS]|uniref:hypothetical protein n=1 Tax=Spiroplasma sp. ChiS TaxID=2099885 RepID=UPI000CF9DC03|nr:hypothetical protein [Spiroplasma sp. ChiS]PQP79219.1 hypothetical protein C6B38_02005 [Spiroplasma sp. ChiS]